MSVMTAWLCSDKFRLLSARVVQHFRWGCWMKFEVVSPLCMSLIHTRFWDEVSVVIWRPTVSAVQITERIPDEYKAEVFLKQSRDSLCKILKAGLLCLGIPASGSWQDLKDHMREAGDVCYADVYRDGTGIVEFMSHDDMKFAVKHLDDTKFRSHEVTFNEMPMPSFACLVRCCVCTILNVH